MGGRARGAPIADLTAALRVERRLVDDDLALVARREGIDLLAATKQRPDRARSFFALVSDEACRRAQRRKHAMVRLADRRLADLAPLAARARALHRLVVAGDVDAVAALLADDL